uniref:Uncharacterized protein n=1 Tax=Caenorhabditis japonica TaxID=281687 RepID=A0A8R1E2I0_CAEJA
MNDLLAHCQSNAPRKNIKSKLSRISTLMKECQPSARRPRPSTPADLDSAFSQKKVVFDRRTIPRKFCKMMGPNDYELDDVCNACLDDECSKKQPNVEKAIRF